LAYYLLNNGQTYTAVSSAITVSASCGGGPSPPSPPPTGPVTPAPGPVTPAPGPGTPAPTTSPPVSGSGGVQATICTCDGTTVRKACSQRSGYCIPFFNVYAGQPAQYLTISDCNKDQQKWLFWQYNTLADCQINKYMGAPYASAQPFDGCFSNITVTDCPDTPFHLDITKAGYAIFWGPVAGCCVCCLCWMMSKQDSGSSSSTSVEMAVKKKCPKCGGHGQLRATVETNIQAEVMLITCSNCNGSGFV